MLRQYFSVYVHRDDKQSLTVHGCLVHLIDFGVLDKFPGLKITMAAIPHIVISIPM